MTGPWKLSSPVHGLAGRAPWRPVLARAWVAFGSWTCPAATTVLAVDLLARPPPIGPAANRPSPAMSSPRPPPSCARTGSPPWWRTSGGCASTQSGSCPQSVTRTSFSMAGTCSRCRTLLRIPPSSTWRMRRCRTRRGPPPTCRCPRWSRPPPAYPSPVSSTTPAQRAWLITVVPGSPAEGRPVTTELAGQVGALAARTSLALQGLFHRAGGRVLDWDVRRAQHVLGEPDVLGSLGALGPPVAGVLPRLAAAADATAALPAGLNNADVTLTNILTSASPGEPAITGLIDFGDMHHTAHVCDLAVTLDLAGAVLAGYQRHRPLTPQEADVLGDLVIGRLALTLVISQRRSAAHEDNQTYIRQYDTSTRRILGELLDLGPDQVTRRLHTLAGTSRVIV